MSEHRVGGGTTTEIVQESADVRVRPEKAPGEACVHVRLASGHVLALVYEVGTHQAVGDAREDDGDHQTCDAEGDGRTGTEPQRRSPPATG